MVVIENFKTTLKHSSIATNFELEESSTTTQLFCRDKKIDDRIGHWWDKDILTEESKQLDFRPDEDQQNSEFTKYNPFFFMLSIFNVFINFIIDISKLFTWIIPECFMAAYDLIVPKDFSKSLGFKKGTKYCINKFYTRILFTIFCPPAGIFMAYGFSGWIQILVCCGLSLLYYFPGLIYAIVVMNRSDVADIIETQLLNNCNQNKDTSFFVSDTEDQPKCSLDIGDTCDSQSRPSSGDSMKLLCCAQPYKDANGDWTMDFGLSPKKEGDNSNMRKGDKFEDGERVCKVSGEATGYSEGRDGSFKGKCVFKKSGGVM
tara:strand:- start:431 stop:1381 length:951 start_codon:yes stop_codon:yes gene_type:complete